MAIWAMASKSPSKYTVLPTAASGQGTISMAFFPDLPGRVLHINTLSVAWYRLMLLPFVSQVTVFSISGEYDKSASELALDTIYPLRQALKLIENLDANSALNCDKQ